ncbi:MAG: DNA-directed RNA polymerase subunit alpha [Kiritimatiellia bacterium]|jgi:DNA-directed RNA polymerase subunit alpha
MPIRLSRFEMPKRVIKDEATATPTYARFVAEPFEVGYALTLGNSLRRVLLSSIEGVAITNVRIMGASHEFCTLPGIAEDVTDIILNLKRVLLKSVNREPRTLRLHRKGPCTVTAADFEADNVVEVLNPDQVIATIDVDGDLDMEVDIRTGRGFYPAVWNKDPQQEIGRIPIDSIFSPVTRVKYAVENTRVGQRTDYERLVLDVWTDGRISPDDALKTAAAIFRHHLDVFVDYSEDAVEAEDTATTEDDEREKLRAILNMSVNEIELSVRSANCLNNASITTVGELASKTEADMLKYRNFGKKSLNEIKEKLAGFGLYLGYKVDPSLMDTPIQPSTPPDEDLSDVDEDDEDVDDESLPLDDEP